MKRTIATVLVLFLGIMLAPLPSQAGISGHALTSVGKALLNPGTYAEAAKVVVKGVEAGVDAVHVVTSQVERGVHELDTALEKVEGAL